MKIYCSIEIDHINKSNIKIRVNDFESFPVCSVVLPIG